MPPQDTTHHIQRPCYQRGSPCQDPAGSWTTWRPPDDRKETQTAVVWSCFLFIRSGRNHPARCRERGKKTRQTEEEVGRQHQGIDRSGVRQVPEGSGEQGKSRTLVAELSMVPQWPLWFRDWWWWWWWLFCQWLLTYVLWVAVDICFVSGCWHLICQWLLTFVLSVAVDICFVISCWHLFCHWLLTYVLLVAVDICFFHWLLTYALLLAVEICFVSGCCHLFCQWLWTFVLSVAVDICFASGFWHCFVNGFCHLFCYWLLTFVLSVAVGIFFGQWLLTFHSGCWHYHFKWLPLTCLVFC